MVEVQLVFAEKRRNIVLWRTMVNNFTTSVKKYSFTSIVKITDVRDHCPTSYILSYVAKTTQDKRIVCLITHFGILFGKKTPYTQFI